MLIVYVEPEWTVYDLSDLLLALKESKYGIGVSALYLDREGVMWFGAGSNLIHFDTSGPWPTKPAISKDVRSVAEKGNRLATGFLIGALVTGLVAIWLVLPYKVGINAESPHLAASTQPAETVISSSHQIRPRLIYLVMAAVVPALGLLGYELFIRGIARLMLGGELIERFI